MDVTGTHSAQIHVGEKEVVDSLFESDAEVRQVSRGMGNKERVLSGNPVENKLSQDLAQSNLHCKHSPTQTTRSSTSRYSVASASMVIWIDNIHYFHFPTN